MKNKKEIEIKILNNEYKVIVCWGDSKYIGKVVNSWGHGRSDVSKELEQRRGACFYAKDCHPIIALPKKPKTPEQIGTLAHEATHAITNIFEKIEEDTSNEIFAHSVGAVVREVLKSIDK